MSERNFVGYEYKEVITKQEMESLYVDGYQNFGWKLEAAGTMPGRASGMVTMKFKRDRKIVNKAELTRLQRQFEACVGEVEHMESSKTMWASIAAFTIGLIGTVFMALSTFSYLGGSVAMMVVFAVPGFLGWILPYCCYKVIRRHKTNQIVPLIEQKYDEMYAVCEKANQLLVE